MSEQAQGYLLHTPGEPGGIGLECLLKLAQQPSPGCRVALTDPQLLLQTAQRLGLDIRLDDCPQQPQPTAAGQLFVDPLPTKTPAVPGQCLTEHAPMQLAALQCAVERLGKTRAAALVTGPVQKSSLASVAEDFRGHTEFLAAAAGVERVVMMLACSSLKVALVTTHLPLAQVPQAIQRGDLLRCLEILQGDLQKRWAIDRPRIAVCGLNPHAGEAGLLGHEEIETIQPALRDAQALGIDVSGPWPADTIFTPRKSAHYDAILAMYHDQGLPTLKYAGFGESVNVTLGLPFIRTSVDHGTGLDIAAQGIADPGSLQHAEALAWQMLCAQARHA